MIEVLYAENKTEHLPSYWDHVLLCLSDKDRIRINKYKKWQDRQASLLGRLLLLNLLKSSGRNYLMLKKIAYTSYGKPYIPGLLADFNISHSGDYVVCTLINSSNHTIGIDIEKINDIDINDFETVFCDEDFEKLKASTNINRSFYELWATKEAALKAQGKGLLGEFKDIRIKGNRGNIVLVENQIIYYKEFMINEEYTSFVASTFPFSSVSIKKVNY